MQRDYHKILEYAETEKQKEKILSIIKLGSIRKAAKDLGISHQALVRNIQSIERKMMIQGYAPKYDQTHPVPETQFVKGVSTYYNKEGEPAAQWVKTSAKQESLIEALKEAVAALKEDITPQEPIPQQSNLKHENLLNSVIVTDLHIGMLAWGQEGGNGWDVKIAERVLKASIYDVIQRTPEAETGLICFLGDTLHYDSLESVTPKNRNPLDSDSRYRKIIRISIKCIKKTVNEMLKRHKKVNLIIAEGNHDLIGSQWLQELFVELYAQESRIDVIVNELPYYCYTFGKTMITMHHGHKQNKDQLINTIPALFPKEWGETKYRYCYSGHVHHSSKSEKYGIISETFPTLAAKDAYASRLGLDSQAGLTCITYHKDHGEFSRIVSRPVYLD